MPLRGALLPALGLVACTAVEHPPAEEHRVRSADGVSIAYEVRGQGEPTLVFVHGWCGDRALWRATMAHFASTRRVLALDLAGHGASGADRSRWTLASLADDVVAAVNDSGAGEVVLIGHSMGAPVALLAAPRLAARVRGVIGVDSLHDVDFAYPPGFLAEVAQDLERDFPAAVEASIRAVVSPATPAERTAWIVARAERTDRAAALGLLGSLEDFDLARALSECGAPVRVINAAPHGGRGLVTALERNRRCADFDASLLEDSGHFPMVEALPAFLAQLERWIQAL